MLARRATGATKLAADMQAQAAETEAKRLAHEASAAEATAAKLSAAHIGAKAGAAQREAVRLAMLARRATGVVTSARCELGMSSAGSCATKPAALRMRALSSQPRQSVVAHAAAAVGDGEEKDDCTNGDQCMAHRKDESGVGVGRYCK